MERGAGRAAAEGIRFPDEIAHFDAISRVLDGALKEAEAYASKADGDYMDAKLYMVQNRGEIDPSEMFLNGLELGRIDEKSARAAAARDKIAKLKASPYFARIDFRGESERDAERHYIGRFAFGHGGELLISDWRSPIAGMFYDYETGPAQYIAPGGKIGGELTLKRQFGIKNGVMEYALESSLNIQDDVLRRELSQTSDEKMKSIIATLQREQNLIIRNEKADTLIIQGVAGSGKTSIALHRVAFLLYRFKDRLKADNVMIISPNRVFADYISSVLPELGEEPIEGASLADLAGERLGGAMSFIAEEDPLDARDAGRAERARFKSTPEFLALLDAFIERMPELAFESAPYTNGGFSETAEWIGKRFAANSKYPVMRRLEMLADDLHERFYSPFEEPPASRTILKALKKMLRIKDALALYKEFCRQLGARMFVMPARKTLEWADVYPYLYIKAAFEGIDESAKIKHLVVDEMQDYTPVQFAALNAMYGCPKTILGDFGQSLNPDHLHTLEDLTGLYPGAGFAQLKKSYRSTCEIIAFAVRIKGADIEAVERHGEIPAVIKCEDGRDEVARIIERIGAFRKSGFSSLGIVAKTNADAKRLFDMLPKSGDIRLIAPESASFAGGVSVTSIRMAKGLEFDEVIVPGASALNYGGEHDKSLLYIACTRAMHRLTLLYSGGISPHLDMR